MSTFLEHVKELVGDQQDLQLLLNHLLRKIQKVWEESWKL